MEFFALIVGAVALVWGAVLLRAGGLLAGCLVVLLAGICFGHPFFNVSVGPLPVTGDRILLGVLFGLTLVYRRWGWTDPKPCTKADWSLMGLFLVLVVSTLSHDWHINKSQPLANLLFLYLLPLVLYWIARQVQVTERAIWAMFLTMAVFGVYLAVTAVAETHQVWALVYPRYIASPDFLEFFGRGRGPLLNPAGSGILQGLCLLAALMLWRRLNRRGQLLLLAVTPLFAWGIYSTFTRSAWMGAALGILVVVGLTLPRAWRTAVIGSVVLVSLPVIAMNWESLLSFKRDKSLSAAEAAESARLRPILATVAWHMFQDRPLLGCGFGQYLIECRPYLSDRSTDLPLEKVRPYVQHNVLLALLAETGLVGMSLFSAAMFYWLREAWRLWQAENVPASFRELGLLFMAFVGVWFPNAMFQDVSIIPMINMLLLFLAGLTRNVSRSVVGQAAVEPRFVFGPAGAAPGGA
jgi:O-antigen ligase